MPTVIETLQEKKAALQAEIAKIEGEIAAIPSEFHTLEHDLWAKIKAWFGVTDTPIAATSVSAPAQEPQAPA